MTLTLVKPIEQLSRGEGGGKAAGLLLLQQYGMQIPETFVVLAEDQTEIKQFIRRLPAGKIYAVRSSADAEDGEELSFAGQFRSFLFVQNPDAIHLAISKCFDSFNSASAETYKRNLKKNNGSQMNVLVQQMIVPAYSGVLFTADPVSHRHDVMAISITDGSGEGLMAGHQAGENLRFLKHSVLLPASRFLSPELLRELVQSALVIEKKYSRPCDMEWAVDAEGRLWWLQLRPVTKLNRVHLNELDDRPLHENPVYTRGNIGEMMPGPVTPLTLSTFARAIEIGLQVFYKKTGALKALSDKNLFVHSYYNHLFFNMKTLYNSARRVRMSSKENIDYAIAGEIIPGTTVKKEGGFFSGIYNSVKMIRYIGSAQKAWRELKKMHDGFDLSPVGDAAACYRDISKNLQVLFDAYTLHYVTSSQSGALYTTILNIYSKGKKPGRGHQQKVARLFTNIPGIESADVIRSVDFIAQLLARVDDINEKFIRVSTEESIRYLSKTGPVTIQNEWRSFMKRHGHRCVREAEMMEKEWALDPSPLVDGLKSKTSHLLAGHAQKINGHTAHATSHLMDGLSIISRHIVKAILPRARKAVARREQTKAWSIGIQNQFKSAYRYLARAMVAEGLLANENHVFFLTHQEIGGLISSGNPEPWKKLADDRVKLFPTLQALAFNDIVYGIPVPVAENTETDKKEALQGIPVSQGIVSGKVRIVRTLDDARKLKKGDIMVARFTDIGWTPFYSVISGLITEIGSPLSHGAVVAREYNLPAVVSMKGALKNLKTGEVITLNAVKGEVLKEESIPQ